MVTFAAGGRAVERGAEGRDRADLIAARAEHLDRDDAAVLRAVFVEGRTAADLSPLLGRRPRAVQRRIARLSARVASPLFVFVLRHRSGWPPEQQRVAEACFLRGRSMRAAAAELGLPINTVRRHTLVVRGLLEASGQGATR